MRVEIHIGSIFCIPLHRRGLRRLPGEVRRQQARPAPLHQPHPLRAGVVPREEGAEEAGGQAGGKAVVAVRPVEPETNSISIIWSWSDSRHILVRIYLLG